MYDYDIPADNPFHPVKVLPTRRCQLSCQGPLGAVLAPLRPQLRHIIPCVMHEKHHGAHADFQEQGIQGFTRVFAVVAETWKSTLCNNVGVLWRCLGNDATAIGTPEAPLPSFRYRPRY